MNMQVMVPLVIGMLMKMFSLAVEPPPIEVSAPSKHLTPPTEWLCALLFTTITLLQRTVPLVGESVYYSADYTYTAVVKEEVRPENEPECAELFESYLKAAKKEETKTSHSKIQNI